MDGLPQPLVVDPADTVEQLDGQGPDQAGRGVGAGPGRVAGPGITVVTPGCWTTQTSTENSWAAATPVR